MNAKIWTLCALAATATVVTVYLLVLKPAHDASERVAGASNKVVDWAASRFGVAL